MHTVATTMTGHRSLPRRIGTMKYVILPSSHPFRVRSLLTRVC